jgi:glycosyltransferase involved in cell wall biosynthesis
MRLYSLPRERFAEAHLGANWMPTQSTDELLMLAEARAQALQNGQPMQLLFVGKDWERKGGPLAMEIAADLHGQGQPVHLHIVGCSPPVPKCNRSFITVHGVLDLGKPESRAQLEALFLASHFLLVPTQAECFGIVFAESQGFAVPPVSRRVHALPSIILDGFTGVLMPRKAEASAYAIRLRHFVTNPEQYVGIATGGRERFLDEFTWQHTAQVIANGIVETL